MKTRLFFLIFLFVFIYGALGVKLYSEQVSKSDYYVGKAEAIQHNLQRKNLRRGQIFFTDRSGALITAAFNKDYPIVFVSPREVKVEDEAAVGSFISSSFGLNESDILKALQNKKSSFFPIREKVTQEQVALVNEAKFKGVYTRTEQLRAYPFEKLGSHVLGFVGVNELYSVPRGLYGIEKFYNDELENGGNILLTIDRGIQSHAEQILDGLIANFGAVGGTIIVEDPKTGKILAAASKPDFDPNAYGSYPIKNFLSPAIHLVYEPGSVMKPITVAAGINSGKLTPDTKFFDKGSVTLNGKTIRNSRDKVYGEITINEVVENSVNTGAVYAEQLVGHKLFYEYLQKFGFADLTGVDFPDEVAGNLRNLVSDSAQAIDFATASFGQGIAVTPLELVNAFSVFANKGLLMRPYFNAGKEPYIIRRVIEEETAKQIGAILESTVEKARVTSMPNYRIAGKTGTAFIPNFESGGYSEEMIHTFVGFAPVSDPKFTALIKLEKPKVGELAGLTVVPAFKNLAQFIFNYYNIPPDKLPPNK